MYLEVRAGTKQTEQTRNMAIEVRAGTKQTEQTRAMAIEVLAGTKQTEQTRAMTIEVRARTKQISMNVLGWMPWMYRMYTNLVSSPPVNLQLILY